MRICIINHTFQQERFYKRWRILANQHKDLDITLLAPEHWTDGNTRGLTYGKSIEREGTVLDEDNFHIRLIDMVDQKYGTWISKQMVDYVLNNKPDIVYHIGEHRQNSVIQLLKLKSKMPNTKFVIFSMRGHQQSLQHKKSKNLIRQLRHSCGYLLMRRRVNLLNRRADAIFCHYPDAMSEFRKEGYKGPIYMQTQVGVDTDIFKPNEEARKRIRDKYNIGDAFLFGSASRFSASKGLDEIIQALPKEGNWKYLMMGWGRDDEVERVKNAIKERGLTDRIILTGFIEEWSDMAAHWNALDCAVHTPLTTSEWEETFSLSLVQAMATGLPVIGSSSGSVPYQIGQDGIIVKERDVDALNKEFLFVLSNKETSKKIGHKMYNRAVNCFSIKHLNDIFYDTILDVVNNKYDEAKIDMAQYRSNEYVDCLGENL